MTPHISAYRMVLQLGGRPGSRPMSPENEDSAAEIGIGVVGSILGIIIFIVLILVCAYCCIVKYKMCTPIPDPTQQERPYRYHDDTNTNLNGYSSSNNNNNTSNTNANNVNESGEDTQNNGHDTRSHHDEEQAEYDAIERRYNNRELIIEAPPNYHEMDSYPLAATSLPSYESLYSSTDSVLDGQQSLNFNNYSHHLGGNSQPNQQGWVYHNPAITNNVNISGLVIRNTDANNDERQETPVQDNSIDIVRLNVDNNGVANIVPDNETVTDADSIMSYHIRFEIGGSDDSSSSDEDI